MLRRLFLLTGLCAALACDNLWRAAAAAENQAERTLIYPCRQAKGPVTIDGRLDPAEWAGAIEVSGFRISGRNKPAPEQVVMRLLYDPENLYVGVKCLESQMKKLKTSATERDGAFWLDDSIEFFIDASHDHETYFQFAATANAVPYDNLNGDSLWNSNWRVAAQRGADSWTVEAAVPFADLKVAPPAPGKLWGFNLCREREAGGSLELYNWADVQGVFNSVPLFGHLRFVAADWPPMESTVADAARGAGGSETLVYVDDGYWRIKSGKSPEPFTYRALLRAHDPSAVPFMEELRGVYTKDPKMILHDEFARLTTRYEEVKSQAAAEGPLGAEEWVKADVFLDGLREKAEDICWRVRLNLLNESF
jgi:hypothetical protein